MRIWKVETNIRGVTWNERSNHLVRANSSVEAIKKACRAAKKLGVGRRYDAISVECLGRHI